MLSPRRLVPLLVLLVAFIALMLVRQPAPAPAAGEHALPPEVVLVARRAIAAGAFIGQADVSRETLREPSLGSGGTPLPPGGLAGAPRYALVDIPAGGTLTSGNVSAKDAPRPIAYALKPGRRAISVPSSSLSGQDRQIVPGSVVDVLLLANAGAFPSQAPGSAEGLPPSAVYALATKVPVLAVTEDGKSSRTFTLDVGIEAAKRIALAQQLGALALLERGNGEEGDDAELSRTVTADQLFGIHRRRREDPGASPATALPEPFTPQVTIYRGSVAEVHEMTN
ncbi:Flp pilus assembly protein CpaB [Amorphus sp. MBR-141]